MRTVCSLSSLWLFKILAAFKLLLLSLIMPLCFFLCLGFMELLWSLGLWFPLNLEIWGHYFFNISLPSGNSKHVRLPSALLIIFFFLYFTLDSSYCRLEVRSSAVNKTDAVPAVMELTCNEQCYAQRQEGCWTFLR